MPEPPMPPPADGAVFDLNFERVFTVAEVAERLGISRRQVEMHIADGALPAVDMGRGTRRRDLRILDEDLDRFVEDRRVAGPFGSTSVVSSARKATRYAKHPPLTGVFIAGRADRDEKGRI